jgi:transposase
LERVIGIAKGTVQNIIERYRDAGTVDPKPPNAGRKAAFRGAPLKRLEQDVLDHPDATLAERRQRSGLAVSLVTVHNTLKRMGFTLKKVHARLGTTPGGCRSTAPPLEGKDRGH